LSIAGGLHRAAEAAANLGLDTVQIFTKNANQWSAKPLTGEQITAWKAAVHHARLKFPTAHDSYLINLAAPGNDLFQKSVEAFCDEVHRAEQLGLSYLVTHPGAHVGSGDEAGLARVATALDEVHRRFPQAQVQILLEVTAGQGTCLGHRFEHLAAILEQVRDPGRLGICFDTCHAFAAGYDLSTEDGYDATFAEFDRVLGLKRLRLFHVNDSAKPLGSRVDRHAGIGLGYIGDGGFRRLVTDRRFRRLPMILETPKVAADGTAMDPMNLAKLRQFLESSSAGPL
jgi:deoxyribonuclease-4